MDNLFSLSGKIALVTGGSSGLGFEISQSLAAAGAQVYINGRNEDRINNAIRSIHQRSLSASSLPFDITDDQAADRAIEKLVSAHGRFDILVNNVGNRDRRSIEELDATSVRQILDTNLIAPFFLCQKSASQMQQQKSGRIINVTSIAAIIARAGDASYTAAKGGLSALTRALAAELGGDNITVNAIAPGFFSTDTNRDMAADPAIADWLSKRTSLGRWGRPEEIAGAAVFLASPAASYVTGQTLYVDGGYTSHF